MNLTHYYEELDYSLAARHDRFEGFDRGDADYDYAAEQLAMNEADEERMYDEDFDAAIAEDAARAAGESA